MKNNLLSRFVFRSIVLSIGESCLMRKTIIEIDVVHFKLDEVGLTKYRKNCRKTLRSLIIFTYFLRRLNWQFFNVIFLFVKAISS